MEKTPKFSIDVLGFPLVFDLTVMISTMFTCIVVFLFMMLATRGRNMRRPTGMQNVMELLIEFMRNTVRQSFDNRTAEKFMGFVVSLFLFIFFANQLGVIMMATGYVNQDIPALGVTSTDHLSFFKSPTADFNVPVVMALAITLFAHFIGITRHPGAYFKAYINPMHIVEEITKPLTHAMRLWANIFAGEILITILIKLGGPLTTGAPLLVWLGYSVFIGAVQAYVFTILATIYISQKYTPQH
ncbi:F0F1 ATP synthase subunit A [Desmospora profundinema]|uniref:ATP synthase subunit a n=1 Tax=Desmospora profundinema TaxID=1571184 RepID=A0ABU1IL50_9BACL|nr:F0F1 ATP synthase subunit A [Desmospora profundinema]MDR6225512.1 F-type H+-transporting ATPase subunit a [Desmospora profundinema]